MAEKKVIIYYNPEIDQLSLCWKSQKCSLTYEEVAKKDVPKGLKYKLSMSLSYPQI